MHNTQIKKTREKNSFEFSSEWSDSHHAAEKHILTEWYLLSRARFLLVGSKFLGKCRHAADCQTDHIDPYQHSSFLFTAARVAGLHVRVASLGLSGFYLYSCGLMKAFRTFDTRKCWHFDKRF